MTPAWIKSLTHNRLKYLPTQFLYFHSKAGPDNDNIYCLGCSNGNASGNNLEEAVLQGFGFLRPWRLRFRPFRTRRGP